MTLYTSDTKRKGAWIKYLIASAVVLACSLIYEHFSHGVYSAYMLGAFLVPLLAGALPCFIEEKVLKGTNEGTDKKRARVAADLQLAAVATLTAGCLMQGVLDIYGTTNRLMMIYPVCGIVLAMASLAVFAAAKNAGSNEAL